MQTSVFQVLHTVPGLRHELPLLVGVSGGADSMCLLHVLTAAAEFPIIVAHLDHQLRQESSADAQHVMDWAARFSLPCLVGKEDTHAFAESHKLSIEEAARELRYRFLFTAAEQHGAQAVLVAHNADDQVETVLMHLLRGSGLSGLTGMPYWTITHWHRRIPLVRPLLDTPRREIEDHCQAFGLETIQDLTNADTTLYRNRLRHELIPFLESYNPQISTLIHQMADTLREDHKVLASLTDQAFLDCQLETDANHIALDLGKFKDQPLGLQRSLVRRAISMLRPGLRDFGYQDVQRVLGYLDQTPKSGQADIAAGLRLQIEADRFLIADWYTPNLRPDWPQWHGPLTEMSIPGRIALDQSWWLKAEVVPLDSLLRKTILSNQDPFTAYFDLASDQTTFSIRSRRSGDRIAPFGMEGNSLKVSELMINAKLPRRARAGWPVVVAGEHIVWVPGIRQTCEHAVGKDTKKVVILNMHKEG